MPDRAALQMLASSLDNDATAGLCRAACWVDAA